MIISFSKKIMSRHVACGSLLLFGFWFLAINNEIVAQTFSKFEIAETTRMWVIPMIFISEVSILSFYKKKSQ